ncbi:uncharacterized protein BO72DRAFT_460463 [Aspergillus fijiensis CBS 313.89]|uniref:Uncharacterized protein n=1 Tax=Aspergillus fijiensis CBS 313.89 TaxID=1448319 RepID=A0A8G1VXK3_9EURO|nr:uncharacterized protein BO72DRAFT_460463 [Aspergillus fijiensis CBS 313.89]RAK75483.1 hypothetical protein BO72DRAFT_460463 [Aspergillus fijiensis CBS 313.89]
MEMINQILDADEKNKRRHHYHHHYHHTNSTNYRPHDPQKSSTSLRLPPTVTWVRGGRAQQLTMANIVAAHAVPGPVMSGPSPPPAGTPGRRSWPGGENYTFEEDQAIPAPLGCLVMNSLPPESVLLPWRAHSSTVVKHAVQLIRYPQSGLALQDD